MTARPNRSIAAGGPPARALRRGAVQQSLESGGYRGPRALSTSADNVWAIGDTTVLTRAEWQTAAQGFAVFMKPRPQLSPTASPAISVRRS